VFAIAALLLAAYVEPASPIEPGVVNVLDLRAEQAEVPAADGSLAARRALWLDWHGGFTTNTSGILAKRLGPTWSFGVGTGALGTWTATPTPPSTGWQGRGAFGCAGRIAAWTTPFAGSVFLTGAFELAGGRDAWWLQGPVQGAVLVGARLLLGHGGPLRSALWYTVTPLFFARDPTGWAVTHLEHRGRFTVALGPIGIGVQATYADTTGRAIGKVRSDQELTVGGLLEWRVGGGE
jgi:hypothetical protein